MSRAALVAPLLSAALLLGAAAVGAADPGARPSGAPAGVAKPQSTPSFMACDAAPWQYLVGSHFSPDSYGFWPSDPPTMVADLPSNRIVLTPRGLEQAYPTPGRLTVVYDPDKENRVTSVFCQ